MGASSLCRGFRGTLPFPLLAALGVRAKSPRGVPDLEAASGAPRAVQDMTLNCADVGRPGTVFKENVLLAFLPFPVLFLPWLLPGFRWGPGQFAGQADCKMSIEVAVRVTGGPRPLPLLTLCPPPLLSRFGSTEPLRGTW